MLVNVEVVKFLQRLMNLNGLQRTLDSAGFPVDIQAYVEQQLRNSFPDQNANGLMKYIKTNFVYFITGDPVKVTKSINDYLLLDPKVIDFFGFPITIYSDPAHVRTYVMYLLGAVVGYKLLFGRR
jgi:hypothetical protein